MLFRSVYNITSSQSLTFPTTRSPTDTPTCSFSPQDCSRLYVSYLSSLGLSANASVPSITPAPSNSPVRTFASLLRRKYPQCLAKRGVLIFSSPVPRITTSRSALAHGHRYTIMRTTATSTETAYSYFTSRPRPPIRAPRRRTPQHHRWSIRGPRGSLSRRPQSICLLTIFLLSASSTTTMTTDALLAIKRDVVRRR